MTITRTSRFALGFLAATLVGLYFSSQFYVNFAPDEPMAWKRALLVNMTYYYLWGAFAPIVIWAARRNRIETRRWLRPALIHVVTSILLTVLIIGAAESLLSVIAGKVRGSEVTNAFSYGLQRNFHSSLPTYWLILLAYYAFDYYVKFRDRELRASELTARLSSAQLNALRMQLNPHFLFNTLNSISSLMYSNVEAADAMITRLSEFLRLTLENEAIQEVSLRQELDFLERYLEIERIRFDDRLSVVMNIDSETLDARVPNLALQPIIENAIHHGIARLPRGGRIELSARRSNGMLSIGVSNDIPPDAKLTERTMHEGIGLTNTRARLQQLYGAHHELRFENTGDGRLFVHLTIPYRTA